MNILCITHADYETPGVVQPWALSRKHGFKIARPYKGEILPEIDAFDCLIVMGGPQSPLALDEASYLADEITLIKKAITQDKRILGFCLGAQLIGEALGAKTEHSPEKEVGVYPIKLTEEGKNDRLLHGLPPSFPVIHWHNDMPGLTKDSVILAYSPGCPRQMVRYKPLIYGFQCHLEIMPKDIQEMIDSPDACLKPSKYTQSKEQLLAQDYTTINNMMMNLLDRFITLEE